MTWQVPPRVGFVDKNGMITREWYLFLEGLYNIATGGSGGLPDDDVWPYAQAGDGLSINGNIDQTPAIQALIASDLNNAPIPIAVNAIQDDLGPSFGQLVAEVAALKAAVDDLRKGTISL